MKTVYNPTYVLVSYNNIPFMVAIDSITIEKYDPHTDREYEEEQPFVESVLMGGHELVDLLQDDVINDLYNLAVTSE
jgi:hypothetical protein